VLTTWDDVKYLGFIQTAWSGAAPTFENLRWTGGEWTFTNGVTSTWLEQFGLGLNDLTVLSDSDIDGLFNWEEEVAGTVPTNNTSGFWFTRSAADSDSIEVSWPTAAGRTYHLYSASNLVDGAWHLEQSSLPYTVPVGITTVQVTDVEGHFVIKVE